MARKKKLDAAKRIIKTMAGRGARRSKSVQRAVENAGISTRTYRTARKQLRTLALRSSRKGRRRGSGTWFVKA